MQVLKQGITSSLMYANADVCTGSGDSYVVYAKKDADCSLENVHGVETWRGVFGRIGREIGGFEGSVVLV